jgi:hypothetical protein
MVIVRKIIGEVLMAPVKKNFKIYQGSTFSEVLRWESSNIIFSSITNITKAAPMVVTAAGHGMLAGWRALISNVVGMTQVNSDEYIVATAVTSSTITFGNINAAGYTAYVSGGVLQYNQPVSLTGYTARMQLRSKITDTITLLELTTENGGITIDTVNNTILLSITAAATTLLTFKSAVYSLEMVNGIKVTPLIYGTITLDSEITR